MVPISLNGWQIFAKRKDEARKLSSSGGRPREAPRLSRPRWMSGRVAEGLPLSELSDVAALLRAAPSQVTAGRQKVGQNEPCPCGSGKKFKKCCGGGPSTL